MKFGNSVTDIFIINHTQFGQDAFRFDISILHCVGLQFFHGHNVYTFTTRYSFSVSKSKLIHIYCHFSCPQAYTILSSMPHQALSIYIFQGLRNEEIHCDSDSVDRQLIQESCAIAKMTARCALYKQIVSCCEIWPFEIIQDGGRWRRPPSWICSNRKQRHQIRRPRKPYPRTKHEVDRTTGCGDMAI